jgi:hypothetical protein
MSETSPVSGITEDMTEQAARALATGDGYLWDEVSQHWQSQYRIRAAAALGAALSGRVPVELPHRSVITADEVTFQGCTDSNPDLCNCGSWAPPTCDACDEEFQVGDEVFFVQLQSLPWLPAGHREQEHSNWLWHVKCDQRSVSGLSEEGNTPNG